MNWKRKSGRSWRISDLMYDTVKLSDVCTLVNGFAFKSKDFAKEGIPVIKIANVKPNKLFLSNLQFVSKEVAIKAEKSRIKVNDILLTMTGNRIDGSPDSWVGKSCVFRESGHYVLNQRVCIVRPNLSLIDNSFLAYALSSWSSQLYFIKHSTSSGGQANISPSIVGELSIPYPDIQTQKRISSILNLIDERIRVNTSINGNLVA